MPRDGSRRRSRLRRAGFTPGKSLRANGSHECAPMTGSVATLLAMTTKHTARHSGARVSASPESVRMIVVMDSGLSPTGRPGITVYVVTARIHSSNSQPRRKSPFPRRVSPGFCLGISAPETQRAWGMPGAQRTRSRACSVENTRVSHHGYAEITRHSRTRMVLTVSFVLSPVTGLFCHRRLRYFTRNLTPASGRQDHTTLPSASSAVRQERIRVHRIPPRVDDVAQRPSFGTGHAKQCP
jgi:hypothetical protein